MDFELSEHHASIRSTVRDFFEKEVKPHARSWDEAERFPSELVPRLAELGLLGIRIPEAYGGAEMDTLSYAIVVEEAARIDGSLALTLASHNGLGTGHILAFGTEVQKQKYLPKAASGEWLAAWALTEPGSGSDAAGLATTAVRDGDDWIIDGSKMFITQGSVGGFCVVLARTSPDAPKQRGITAFVVDRGTPGFRASKHLEKLGMRSSDTVELTFEQVRVSDAQRVGEVDAGFLDTMAILDRGRVSIAALAVGLGQGALEQATTYAKDRKQFGKPIGDFQAIQWSLADSRVEIDAARLLTYRAALLADQGKRFSREASMAKLFASEAASRICNRGLQIHGGYGFTREFAIERFLRDAKLCEIGEGTSDVQRMVIAKHVLALPALPRAECAFAVACYPRKAMADRFKNVEDQPHHRGLHKVIKWRLGFGQEPRKRSPNRAEVPRVHNDGAALVGAPHPSLTWIGHATYLVQTNGLSIVTDPVLSSRIAVVPRNVPPGLAHEALPRIDVVLLTHNHMDHLDLPTLRRLGKEPLYIVPHGIESFLRRRGFPNVRELGWWEHTTVRDVRFTFVPSQHWSRRGLLDEDKTLWGGFVIDGEKRLYHSGDTAYFGGFHDIGKRLGRIDAAMLPIGAYEPRWFMKAQHMNPDDAVQAFLDLGAEQFFAMHWGTFKLTDEPLLEPPARTRELWDGRGLDEPRLVIPAVGETVLLK